MKLSKFLPSKQDINDAKIDVARRTAEREKAVLAVHRLTTLTIASKKGRSNFHSYIRHFKLQRPSQTIRSEALGFDTETFVPWRLCNTTRN